MAHFAELDENNLVLRVLVLDNHMMLDEQGQESENLGIEFLKSLYGQDTLWVQTSYNGNFRVNYAGPGYTYDLQKDVFVYPKPEGDYWMLDEETYTWYDPATKVVNTDIGVTRA